MATDDREGPHRSGSGSLRAHAGDRRDPLDPLRDPTHRGDALRTDARVGLCPGVSLLLHGPRHNWILRTGKVLIWTSQPALLRNPRHSSAAAHRGERISTCPRVHSSVRMAAPLLASLASPSPTARPAAPSGRASRPSSLSPHSRPRPRSACAPCPSRLVLIRSGPSLVANFT